MIGIYKITSPSGKIYIGQSWNIEKRFYDYKRLLNCKGQRYLYRSFLKHGVENHEFEIVNELPFDIEQEVLDKCESFVWKQFTDTGFDMLNIKEPGQGGKHHEETKELIRKKLKGNQNNLGIKHTLEAKKKMSDSKRNKKRGKYKKQNGIHGNKGRSCSEITKEKIRIKLKGNKNAFNKTRIIIEII